MRFKYFPDRLSDQKGTYPEPLVSCGTLLRYVTRAGDDTLRLLSFA